MIERAPSSGGVSGRVSRPCIHCGEPTDSHQDEPAEQIFCCNGCRGAYELIHGWGLEGFYGLRDQLASGPSGRVNEHGGRFEVFDDAEFLGPSDPVEQSDGLMCSELAIHGLHCAACAWLIENAAIRTPGWNVARVKMSDHTLRVVFDPTQTTLSRIAGLLHRIGYELAPISKQRDQHFQNESRRHLIRIAIAGFFAANAMWIAVALYAGDAYGVAEDHRFFLRMIGTVLGVLAVAFPGRTFFVGAWASIRNWVPHMDLPVALGLSVGTVVGTINAITGFGHLYFDSLAVLVFLLLIGRWIQFHQQHRAAKAVDLLLRITPRHADRVNEDDTITTVLVDALIVGDVIRVAANENIPADGELIHGDSTIDRSLLTGESLPVSVVVGDSVSAGTLNLRRVIDIRVEATGGESRIGKVMQSVEEATNEKTPIVQFADSVGGVFVVIVSLLAVGAFVWWFPSGWSIAASHATSLLIVACPCALALATPLAIAVSLGRAAKHKILIRDGSTLQQLAKGGRIWFDKTGTLTTGRPDAELVWGDLNSVGLAAAVEQHCNHPVAQAIKRLALRHHRELPDGVLNELQRTGVSGTVDNHHVLIGNVTFIESHQIMLSDQVRDSIHQCTESAASPILICIDGAIQSVLAISDPLKPHVASTIAGLLERGWRVGILSGDHPEIVQRIAQQVGIESAEAHGGMSPEEKLATVRRPLDQSKGMITVMVGDGANDAPALAAADIGVAVRGGAEVSLQAAPVFIADGDIRSVDQMIRSATRTDWLIRSAFAISLAYNLIAVGLAMFGKISPLIAAVLMPASSVSVLALTLAWPTFPPTAKDSQTQESQL